MDAQDYIQELRREYSGRPLDETKIAGDPIEQFSLWLEDALQALVPDPHAMVVATADRNGKPSARVVLLRGFSKDGFAFFTDYRSRKGSEILENPRVAAVFFWHELDRQVRVEGTVEKLSASDSDKYFQSRPRENQIAAWASGQSGVISTRAELDERFAEFEKKFANQPVQRPDNWGGFRIKPESVEFWQGRPSRLHDRILYTLNKTGSWEICRLAP